MTIVNEPTYKYIDTDDESSLLSREDMLSIAALTCAAQYHGLACSATAMIPPKADTIVKTASIFMNWLHRDG